MLIDFAYMLFFHHMRPSSRLHTLAVLRTFLGLTQKEMADLAECSRPTIQAIELNKLKLSEKLGVCLMTKTGISLDWLMRGDVAAPPIDTAGKPYTVETFERTRANDQSDPDRFIPNYFDAGKTVALCFALMLRAALAAHKSGQVQLLSYRLTSAITEVAQRFPGYEDLLQTWKALLAQAATDNRREEAVGTMYFDFLRQLNAELSGRVRIHEARSTKIIPIPQRTKPAPHPRKTTKGVRK
jgi:DNA-binding XRE family transcriptional regulator